MDTNMKPSTVSKNEKGKRTLSFSLRLPIGLFEKLQQLPLNQQKKIKKGIKLLLELTIRIFHQAKDESSILKFYFALLEKLQQLIVNNPKQFKRWVDFARTTFNELDNSFEEITVIIRRNNGTERDIVFTRYDSSITRKEVSPTDPNL